MKIGISLALALVSVTGIARAGELPAHLNPPAPFPRVLAQAPTIEVIAPGVTSAEYDLVTEAGPLVAYVVAVAPNRTDVSVQSVLSADALTSNGETISSMARRTNAVAGINADYFDIGNTNRPTNIVVRNGRLLRTPRKRYSLVIPRTGSPQIVESGFTGELQLAGRTVSLDAINEMPPPGGGISLLTPEYGAVAPLENLTLVALAPDDGTGPFTSYHVTSIADNLARQPPGYYAAIGLNAYGAAGVPNPGDTIVATGDLSPVGIGQIAAAVGGGPLILQNGNWTDDPDGPNGADYSARSPSSGAAIEPDGTLLLIEVDGRQPDRSVGVTRREFAALMRALGGLQGLAFDGGGSSEIALRDLGTSAPALKNRPSDGVERPVADGMFVYSEAPGGAPSDLIAHPSAVRAVPGASVDFRVAAIDRGDHVVAAPGAISAGVAPTSLGTYADGRFTARSSGTGELVFRSGALRARVPINVFVGPARLEIIPAIPNVPPGGHLRLNARAFDVHGFPVALPDALPWRANGGHIGPDGMFDAGSRDTSVSLTLGAAFATTRVTVGTHDAPLAFGQAHFLTVPRAGDGDLTETADGLQLRYALGDSERAAYAAMDVALPQGTIGLAFDVFDDGSGAKLRVSVRNSIDEQFLLPATTLDHPGWRRVAISLPQSLGTARLSAIYVIGKNATVHATGSILIKALRATIAGSP